MQQLERGLLIIWWRFERSPGRLLRTRQHRQLVAAEDLQGLPVPLPFAAVTHHHGVEQVRDAQLTGQLRQTAGCLAPSLRRLLGQVMRGEGLSASHTAVRDNPVLVAMSKLRISRPGLASNASYTSAAGRPSS